MNKWFRGNNWLFVLIGLLLFGLFGALGVMDLRGEEPRRALVAWEMWQRSDWLVPTIQGWPYYNKPPLFNWILMALYELTGSAENWVVRLPSLAAFLGMALLHYRFSRQWVGEAVARWSSLFMLTAVHYLFFATVLSGELDLFYALIVYGQSLVLFAGFQKKQWLWMFSGAYLLMGIGFLTKGMPSILFQGATLLGMAVLYKKWKWLFSWQHFLGAVIGLLPVAAYFGLYEQRQGAGWLYLFNLLEEATQKSAGERSLLDIFLHLFEFPFQFFVDHLPWSLVLFLLPFSRIKKIVRENAFLQYAFLFLIANIWIYWISPGTRQRYLYMFLPYVMTLLAAFFEGRRRPVSPRLVILLMLLLATARIAYNYTLLPYQQRTMKSLQDYRAIIQAAQDGAQSREIRTFGIPDTIFVNPSLGPLVLLEDTIYIPQYYPYQIPFELAKGQKAILKYDTVALPNILYLTTDSLLPPEAIPGNFQKDVWDEKKLKTVSFSREARPVPVQ
jgi:4-amino-4-deoxy-L-arabinose transferase-like glycosyltransferase